MVPSTETNEVVYMFAATQFNKTPTRYAYWEVLFRFFVREKELLSLNQSRSSLAVVLRTWVCDNWVYQLLPFLGGQQASSKDFRW